MLCKKCGAEIPDNAKKCEYCGAVVKQENTNDIHNKNEQNRQSQIDKMLEDKRAQLDEIQQRRDIKRSRQKKLKIAGIAAACVAGAGALGGGAYYIYDSLANPTVVVIPSPSPQTAHATAIPVSSFSPLPSAAAATPEASAEASEGGTASWRASGSSSSGGSSSGGSSSGGSSSGASSSGGSSSGSSSSGGSASSGSSSSGSSSSGGSSSGSSSSGGSSSGASSSGGSGVSHTPGRDSGVTSGTITSKIAVGNEVIHDGDNWYMTFTSDGVKYYANVNAGATTAQVSGMEYTVTANPTDATYNGNTIFDITSLTKYDGKDYILPYSGTRLIEKADLTGLSSEDLALARNEIYARHGRRFKTAAYQQYFESKAWYKENPNYNYDDDNSNLNEIEIKNVQFIIDYES